MVMRKKKWESKRQEGAQGGVEEKGGRRRRFYASFSFNWQSFLENYSGREKCTICKILTALR